MRWGPDAARGHVDLAGIGLGIGDELSNCVSGDGWIQYQNLRLMTETRDWCYVADEIEIEFFVERRVDGIRCSDEKECVAIGGRTGDNFGGDIGASSGPVLDDDWPAKA